ncbi:MAG: hemerythrin [Alphaproteobacteria bacterium]|nr:MAG: hemerythrin [Alphaproteobacteria bacterium]
MLFNTDSISKVAYEDMNEVHLEEIVMANAIHDYLSQSVEHDQNRIEEMLKEFVFHVRDHFDYEEQMMKDSNCPILGCHESEHRRVLQLMFQVFRDFALAYDIQLLKDYFEYEFKTWIENHILTMDTVTATYLSNISNGENIFLEGRDL